MNALKLRTDDETAHIIDLVCPGCLKQFKVDDEVFVITMDIARRLVTIHNLDEIDKVRIEKLGHDEFGARDREDYVHVNCL